jgi:hypothetical protein
VHEVHQPYFLILISSIHHSCSDKYAPPHCTYFLVPSLVINIKVHVQRDFSIYPFCGYTLLWSFQPFPLLSLTFHLPTPIFQQFSIYILISSTFTCYVLQCWYSIVLFSFPSFPKFHRIISLLQTCSTYAFVYDHTCFCVYVYLLDLSSIYEWKYKDFVFLSLAYFK